MADRGPSFAETPDAVAHQVAEEFRFAVDHEAPLFLLVHYDHEQDKVHFLDALRRLVANDGYGTQTLDPAHRPEHGAGFLYPLLGKADDQTLTLVTSLPRAAESSRPDGIFLGYINLHRDDIGRRRLRWVLCLHTSEVEAFQDRAGDLWDVRQRTYWIERQAGNTPGKAFLEADHPRAIATLATFESPGTIEASSSEIEREVQRVRDRVRGLELPRHKVGALLGLAGWLNRRRAFRHAIEAATAGLEFVGEAPSVERANLLHELAFGYSSAGHIPEALERYEECLKICQQVGERDGEGRALNSIAVAYLDQGKLDQAIQLLEESLNIRQEVGDRAGEGTTLNNIASVFQSWGRLDQAIERYKQSLEIRREVGDRKGEGTTLNNIASAYLDQGKLDQAVQLLEESLNISREVGDRKGEGNILNNIGGVYLDQGKLDQAIQRLEESLNISREVGDRAGQGTTLNNIALVYKDWGKLDDAIQRLEESLNISREVGNRAGQGTALNNIASVYEDWGEHDQAIHRLKQSLKIRREVGDRAGEAATRWNMGLHYERTSDLDRAIVDIRASVALQEALNHPNLEPSRVYLAELEARLDAERSLASEVAEPATPYRADAN